MSTIYSQKLARRTGLEPSGKLFNLYKYFLGGTKMYEYQEIVNNKDILNNLKTRDNLTLKCDSCQQGFKRSVKRIKENIKDGMAHSFCSVKCSSLYYDNRITIKCNNCNKDFKRTKNAIKDLNFCSKRCSAIYNGKLYPKRKKEKKCLLCPTKIYSSRTYCKKCYNDEFLVDWSKVTYGELKMRYKYQKNTRIRSLARKDYLSSGRPRKCFRCGYDKHFEICHIKAISDHSDSSTISEINQESNTIALCPNCHWELDYGDLTIEEILDNKKEP